MVSRSPVPNSYRWLEWGTSTSTPRSRVFDSAGNFVFTGSRVKSTLDPDLFGDVVELLSPQEVVVDWSSGRTCVVCPDALRVTRSMGSGRRMS